MFACIRRCITCGPCRSLPEYDEEDERFLLKHTILTKGSYIVVVYFIEDTAGGKKCKEYTNDQYNIVNNVTPEVSLAKESGFTCSIVLEEGNARISPSNSVPVSYKPLKQACVIHKVRIKTAVEGGHPLQIHVKMGSTIKHSFPFHIDLTSDDLYESYAPPQAQNSSPSSPFPGPSIDQMAYYQSIQDPPLRRDSHSGSNLREILRSHESEHIWPILERGGITTVSQLASVEENKLESIGLNSNDDRLLIEKLKRNLSSSSQDNAAFVSEGNFSNEDSRYQKQQPNLPPRSSSINANQTDKDKTKLSDMLRKLDMENLMPIFENEKISFDKIRQMGTEDFNHIGIGTSQGEKIMNEVGNCNILWNNNSNLPGFASHLHSNA